MEGSGSLGVVPCISGSVGQLHQFVRLGPVVQRCFSRSVVDLGAENIAVIGSNAPDSTHTLGPLPGSLVVERHHRDVGPQLECRHCRRPIGFRRSKRVKGTVEVFIGDRDVEEAEVRQANIGERSGLTRGVPAPSVVRRREMADANLLRITRSQRSAAAAEQSEFPAPGIENLALGVVVEAIQMWLEDRIVADCFPVAHRSSCVLRGAGCVGEECGDVSGGVGVVGESGWVGVAVCCVQDLLVVGDAGGFGE